VTGIKSEKLTFPGVHGDVLAGRLERPDGAVRAFAVFAHCFTCGKDIRAASTISRTLAHEGIGVLRFDFTGLGSSEGDFANTTFSSNIGDLVAAARHLEREHGPARLLIGHSLGGAAVLAAAAKLPAVRAVATIAAPFDAGHLRRLLADDLETIEREGEAVVSIAGREFRIRREFLEDLRDANSQRAIAELGRPLMVFHSPHDRIVTVDNARLIFEAARHPKSFVSLDEADHLLSSSADAAYVARILSAWATRYL
jgi:pimeloyl-ACP methyl ester carboxylesterase